MAIDPEQLFAKALVAIEENKLFFIEDIIAMLGIAKPTLYRHFRPGGDEMNAIKLALESNRIRLKVALRAKMARSDQTGHTLALYKWIGSEEERRRLSMSEVKVSGNLDNQPAIDLGLLTMDE